MTDEQIIKALKRCFTRGFDESDCYECPFYTATAKCTEDLRDSVLDFINRQKAEIEESKTEIERMENQNTLLLKKKCKDINTARKIIKSEAIKDFAKRLKSKLNDLEFRTKTHRKTVPTKFCDNNANWVMHECVSEEIDKLVKEMTEVER